MFDFGDELTIQGYGVPWLIWIQILVLFLLIFLLFYFSFFASDPSEPTTSSSSSSTASPSTTRFFMPLNSQLSKQILKHNDHTATTVASHLRHSRVRQNPSIKGEITTNTGRRIASEDIIENSSNYISFHPCNYFRLAKLAFLKCFGLDFTADNSSSSEQKRDR